MNTRFAPSPTGYLHVGGIRTALFNWALARQSKGNFVLRIDDTDQSRHVPDAVDKIYEDLNWLGIDFDNIIKQSERSDVYQEALEALFDKGYAYQCTRTDAELKELKKDPSYVVRRFRTKGCTLCGTYKKRKLDGPIRIDVIKVFEEIIKDDKIKFNDLILGDLERSITDIGDFAIARQDGSFLYNFTTVVDDAQCDITHVVRGQEHLSNAFIQLLLARIFEIDSPFFAHIPYICAPNSTKKMSKRDAVPATLDIYRQKGYLPEAIFNYLTHLGWALDSKREVWSKDEFVSEFKLEKVIKKPARFDPDKLLWLQGQYMNGVTIEQKLNIVKKIYDPKQNKELLKPIIEGLGDRFRVGKDILQHRHFFDDEELKLTVDDFKKIIAPSADLLREFWAILNRGSYSSNQINWNEYDLEDVFKNMCLYPCRHHPFYLPEGGKLPERKQSFKPKLLAVPLRLVLTGSAVGFSLFKTMVILGRQRVLQRIENALAGVRNG